ncbi:hypothetical protein XBJ1_0314 [Xenorhabdus bovienii SS-2004]|uniref:Uncharacterized protein n=1 Tax=Xenorhabdus bovienii (strain SS-2004) TaxID=406818 RepID=D3UYT6_XENBS|nr:hypothetical protein [Xenorhabdus bovienii]CBJ79464.1 hypothetical protein XBJ1_0314 [Xenorhabdus bovienii SS-2004]
MFRSGAARKKIPRYSSKAVGKQKWINPAIIELVDGLEQWSYICVRHKMTNDQKNVTNIQNIDLLLYGLVKDN